MPHNWKSFDDLRELFPLEPAALLPAADPQELLKRQQAVVAMGRRALAPPEHAILIYDAAALIAEMLDAEHFLVAEISPDGSALLVRLALREPDAEEPRVVTEQLGTDGHESLSGYALQVAHPVIVNELMAEKDFCDRLLSKHGIRSALAVPLKLRDREFGALAACSVQPQRFHAEDMLFAETIAHLAATTIARSQAEKSLAEERRISFGVLQTVGALVLVLDGQGRILRINRACEQATGFSLADIKDRSIWDVFPIQEEADLFRGVFNKLRRGIPRVECESSLLTKHGERRRIRWVYSGLSGAKGTLESIIATGIDVTAPRARPQSPRGARAADQAPQTTGMSSDQAADPAEQQSAAPAEGEPAASAPSPFAPLPDPIHKERRRRPRRSYPYRQSIAYIFDDKLPPPGAFREVQCNDIAAGGFAYLADRPPESDMLVVALGTPPKLTHVIAQVAHVTRIQQDGKPMYMVGCNYTGRAPY